MALIGQYDMNKQARNNLTSVSDSDELKKLLTKEQEARAKSQFLAIRKSFLDSGCPMTRHDKELAELIRHKILDVILAEGF
jgi:hypothetical protein